jgi:hypothetical protein
VKRQLLVVLSLILVLSSGAVGQPKKKKRKTPKKPCAVDLAHCPDEGCGGKFDPNLNRVKNITALSGSPEDKDYSYLAGLPKTVPGYKVGNSREKLQAKGEGKAIRVVAYVLTIRHEHGESCNCGLNDVEVTTDNHLVIVSPVLKSPTLAKNEPTSQTAEFTPRVRLDHKNFNFDTVNPLIKANGGKLLVRLTGQQMYDSEHAQPGRNLKRKSDWEIHPIFKFEYCPKDKSCTKGSDANWVDLDQ